MGLLDRLKEKDKKKLISLDELAGMHRIMALALNPSFHIIFGTSLKPYWDGITGFDIVKFDHEYIRSGSNSMHNAVLDAYGEEGITLIHKLINKVPMSEEDFQSATDWLGKPFVDHFRYMFDRMLEADED